MQKEILNVQEPYRSLILSGEKTIEGRLNKGKFAAIQVGSILVIEPEKIEFEVIGKKVYKTFEEMIEGSGIENVIPDKDNLIDAVNVYYKFYTKEQEKEHGVVAIQIKKLD